MPPEAQEAGRQWLRVGPSASPGAFLPTGALLVAFVLVMNLARVMPLASLGTTLLLASGLYWLWAKKGRPRGIAGAETTE